VLANVQIELVQVYREPLIQHQCIPVAARQMEVQPLAPHTPQRLLGQGIQVDVHDWRFSAGPSGDAADFQGWQGQVRTGAELAAHALEWAGEQGGSFGQYLGLAQRMVGRGELHQRHAGQWPQDVRVDQLQQRVGQLRQVVLDLHGQARGQEGEVLHHALGVCIRGGTAKEGCKARLVLYKIIAQRLEVLLLQPEPIFKLHVKCVACSGWRDRPGLMKESQSFSIGNFLQVAGNYGFCLTASPN